MCVDALSSGVQRHEGSICDVTREWPVAVSVAATPMREKVMCPCLHVMVLGTRY